MTPDSPNRRSGALELSVAALEREVDELKGHLRHQGDLNQKLVDAFSKSAQTIAIINQTQAKLVKRQGLFLMILMGKLGGGVSELRTLLQAIATNPETPDAFAKAASELDVEIQGWTTDQDAPRWIPEIVGGTDVED